METKNLEDSKGFITFREYTESQNVIKRELLRNQEIVKKDLTKRMDKNELQIEKLDTKVEIIDDKIVDLKELVIPLTIAMESTAKNTKQMAKSLEKFAENQTTQNGLFQDKFHMQELAIEGLKNITSGFTDKKKYNAAVTVAAIGLIATFIGGMFTLAPHIAPFIFKN